MMRRKDREITDFQELIAIMKKCDICRIALNDSSGYPYILPLNFGMEIEGEKVILYFHGAPEGKKYELMQADSRVSFEMDYGHALETVEDANGCRCSMKYESVIGRGKIVMPADEEKKKALDCLMAQYHGTGRSFFYDDEVMARTKVFRLEVISMTGKRR